MKKKKADKKTKKMHSTQRQLILQGGAPLTYKDFYAHAGDIDGTDISDKIQVVGDYDINKIGDYNLTLVVKLSNGKELKQDVVACVYN